MKQLNDTLKIKDKRSFILPPKGSNFSDWRSIKKNLEKVAYTKQQVHLNFLSRKKMKMSTTIGMMKMGTDGGLVIEFT